MMPLSNIHCSRLTTHCSRLIAHCSLLIAHGSLLTALVITFALGIHGKPALLHPLFLLKDLEYAPEARAPYHAQHGTQNIVGHQQAGNDKAHACYGKQPPYTGAEIILSLDNQRMKKTYHHKGDYGNYQTRIIHI